MAEGVNSCQKNDYIICKRLLMSIVNGLARRTLLCSTCFEKKTACATLKYIILTSVNINNMAYYFLHKH